MDIRSNRFFDGQHYAPLPVEFELVLVAWQFKTPENLGGLMRLAANLGLKQIWAVKGDVPLNMTKVKRVARSAFESVALEFVQVDQVLGMASHDYAFVGLETAQGSVNLFSVNLPDKLVLFLGNEQCGLPAEVLEKCNVTVHLPLAGSVKSMNVVQAATVAGFEWFRQKTV